MKTHSVSGRKAQNISNLCVDGSLLFAAKKRKKRKKDRKCKSSSTTVVGLGMNSF